MEPSPLEITDVAQDAGQAAGQGGAGAEERRVALKGEVDVSSSVALAAHLDQLLASGATRVVLDASAVSFIDSTGLRVLVEVASRLEIVGGALVVDPMSASVRRVLEITGLLDRYTAG